MTFAQLFAAFTTCMGVLLSLGYYPQAYKIWKRRSAEGVSLATYAIFILGTNTYLAYGFYTHSFVLIAGFLFGAIGSWLVLALALYYRSSGH